MPLVDFVWEDEISEKDGVPGIAATAKDQDTGRIVEVFVTAEYLREMEKRKSSV